MKRRLLFALVLILANSLHAQLPFSKVTPAFPLVSHSFAVWGDFNNDGALDVVVSGATATDSLVTEIYRNDSGTFTDIHANLPGFRQTFAEWGDYDNDGDLDLLLTGLDASSVPQTLLFRNDNGTFVNSGIIFPGIADGQAVFGDYDNDGDLDILMAGSFIAKIFRNDGNSVFTDIQAPLPPVQAATVAWGDYNNDGWLDALVGGDTGSGNITELFNNTAGIFALDTITLPGLNNGMAKWADLDLDGRTDLILDGMDEHLLGKFLIFRNDGNGHFFEYEGYSFPHGYGSVDVMDYDNDGYPDILIIGQIQGCGGAALNVLYHNEGYMVLTSVVTQMDGFTFGSVGWGDYNNDGFADLMYTGTDNMAAPNTEIYRNVAGDTLFHVNTNPVSPEGLTSQTMGSDVTLTWNSGNDLQTDRKGLTYNLFVGKSPDKMEVLAPMSNISTGFLLKPSTGNTGMDTTWTLHNLENGTYYWSVQSVDNGFMGSPFAPVQSFALTTSGIETISSEEIKITPNPAKELIQVSGVAGKYTIVNSTGQEVAGGISPGPSDISKLPAGLYLIQVHTEKSAITGKFVKL